MSFFPPGLWKNPGFPPPPVPPKGVSSPVVSVPFQILAVIFSLKQSAASRLSDTSGYEPMLALLLRAAPVELDIVSPP